MWIIKVYGISQIAKYVPGNIFQFVGRQSIGQAAGIPAWPLAKSIFWELVLLSSAGTVYSIFILPHYFPFISLSLVFIVFTLCIIFAIVVLWKIFSLNFAVAFMYYLVFLSMTGLIFFLVSLQISGRQLLTFEIMAVFTSSFIVAWLIGLITPGAPAGLGVREFVLIVLLKNLIGESDILYAVLLGRTVNVLGDLFYYIVSLFIRNVKRVF